MKSFLALAVLAAVFCSGNASPTSQNATGLRHRFRRDASVRCCNDGFEDTENHAKVAEVRHECAEELGLSEMSEEELLKDREHLICLVECITKKHDLADEHGNLHHDELEKAIHEHFSVAEWKAPLLDGFIKECFDEAEDEHAHHETEEGKCNEEGFQFAYCLWRHFTLACPEEMQDKSERCDGIRSKLVSNEKVSFWNNDIDES